MAKHQEQSDTSDSSCSQLVQMVVQLKPTKASGELLTPDESAALADQVLARVASEVGRPATRVNVMRNLSTLVVEADGEFQASLARQPEVKSIMPNKLDESPLIPPVRKRNASKD